MGLFTDLWRRLVGAGPGGSRGAAGAAPAAGLVRGGGQERLPHDEPMMRRALGLARRAADLGEVPIGAVVYRTETGEVLGEGYNRREIDHDPAAHAELIAIRQAAKASGDWRLNHCTLVVTLEPCAMCAGLIVNARVGRLVYGAADPKAGATGTLYRLTEDPRLNHRIEPVAGVLGEECGEILREFFRGLRRGRA